MISLLSLNGILALSGVVVNDSLLLVSRFNALRESVPVETAVIGLYSRLRLCCCLNYHLCRLISHIGRNLGTSAVLNSGNCVAGLRYIVCHRHHTFINTRITVNL